MQVFISYKRENEDFARKLHNVLIGWGFAPWLDVIDIRSGEDWDTTIHAGLRDSNIVIGVMTPESLASRNVLDEWDYAIRNEKQLFILLLREVPEADIPPRYGRIQRINFLDGMPIGFTQLQKALNQFVQITAQKYDYTILDHSDVSSSGAKRYSANVLADGKYTRVELKLVIRQATNEIRKSRYYKTKRAEQFFGNQDADAVFLFLYTDLKDSQAYFRNWICRTRWLSESYPSNLKLAMWEPDDVFDGIAIDWNADHVFRQKNLLDEHSNKEDWVKKVEIVLPQVREIVLTILSHINKLESDQIEKDEFEREMIRLELIALNLYSDAGNQRPPPLHCAECDSVFMSMMATFHNMLVPFSALGNNPAKWQDKMITLKRNLKLYEDKAGEFGYEWRKIRL